MQRPTLDEIYQTLRINYKIAQDQVSPAQSESVVNIACSLMLDFLFLTLYLSGSQVGKNYRGDEEQENIVNVLAEKFS